MISYKTQQLYFRRRSWLYPHFHLHDSRWNILKMTASQIRLITFDYIAKLASGRSWRKRLFLDGIHGCRRIPTLKLFNRTLLIYESWTRFFGWYLYNDFAHATHFFIHTVIKVFFPHCKSIKKRTQTKNSCQAKIILQKTIKVQNRTKFHCYCSILNM